MSAKMLREDEIQRYARHIILPEVGGIGQERLLAARVLVIGAGGLGAPTLLYLAAAGVGTIGIVDDDTVDLSNLQRQVIHGTPDVGRRKIDSAADRIAAINPGVKINRHPVRLDRAVARELVAHYDVIVDGSDNFATRFALNDACVSVGRTLVTASLHRFDGQLTTIKPHAGPDHPCYRCLVPEAPPAGTVPSCSEAGILGAVAGVLGTLQSTEVLKELLGIGDSLSGWLLLYDALNSGFHRIRIPRDPMCPTCGHGARADRLDDVP